MQKFNVLERDRIKKQIGSLEDIRKSLGLSQRKFCQMLLVDPSSWNRWHEPGRDAPPYIYKSLLWGMSVLEENPQTHPSVDFKMQEFQLRLERSLSEQQSEIQSLKNEIKAQSFAPKNDAFVENTSQYRSSAALADFCIQPKQGSQKPRVQAILEDSSSLQKLVFSAALLALGFAIGIVF